jgi:hypothetical protein
VPAFEGEIPESYAERVFAALDADIPISVEATFESGELRDAGHAGARGY